MPRLGRQLKLCNGSAWRTADGSYWPKAAELGDATVRQLSGEHRTCCQRSRNGSLSPDSYRARRMLVTEGVGQIRPSRGAAEDGRSASALCL
jgi:hypothetical protein